MKTRTIRDERIKQRIAKSLSEAVEKRAKSTEQAAALLQVELGTLYKYMNGEMIPGGQVLWRACKELGMVLDQRGLHLSRRSRETVPDNIPYPVQYELPFVDGSVEGGAVHLEVRRKQSQYVHVRLKIRVA